MKKILLPFVIILVCFSCKKTNLQANKDDVSEQDSMMYVRYNDSIKREQIFEALGDTAFGKVCYGTDYKQFINSTNEFRKSLAKNTYYDFNLAGCNFKIKEPIYIEDYAAHIHNHYSVLERIKDEKFFATLFYDKKLCAICWYTTDISSSISSGGAKKMIDLISLFERKYGKPNIEKPFDFSGVVAEWETYSKKVTFMYKFNQSRLYILFLNKLYKRKIDNYIDKALKQERERQKREQRKDSINNINAL